MAAIELDLDLSDMPDLVSPEVPVASFRLSTPTPSPIAVEEQLQAQVEAQPQPVAEPSPITNDPPSVPYPKREGFRSVQAWEEPRLRRRRYRAPSFDWSEAIENELDRFSPQQYMQYTFEVTAILTFMFPRIALIPASVLMVQRCVTLVRQIASDGVNKDDRIPTYTVACLSLVISLVYASYILGILV